MQNSSADATVLNRLQSVRTSPSISVKAWAKVNLSLVVFEKRADNFHKLHTVMALFDLHDDLHFHLTDQPQVELYCTGLACPAGRDNLVFKAAELLAEHVGIKPAVRIELNKRIPAAAGLGGASSDAAATLEGLNQFWQLHLKRTDLMKLAARLGSDVPFFLHPPVAVCTGRGECVQPIPHRCRRTLLLIIPDIQVSTAQVYQHYVCDDRCNKDHMRRVRYFLRQGDLDGLIIQGINSLAPTSMEICPPLKQLRQRLEELKIGPLNLSGSGSCLFATSHDRERIEQWARQIDKEKLAHVQIVNFINLTEPFPEVHHANL